AERSGIDAAARLLMLALQSSDLEPTKSSRADLADMALASGVELRLVDEIGCWATHLQVTAFRGQMVLSGEVPVEKDRSLAEEIARQTSGGVDVKHELVVPAPPVGGI